MKKLVLLSILMLALLPLLAVAQTPTAAQGPKFSAQTPWAAATSAANISFSTSTALSKTKAGTWKYGNVVGVVAKAKGPFRVKVWAGGSTNATWVPCDTLLARGVAGSYAIEFPVNMEFYAEMDSMKFKPASSDSVWWSALTE